MVRIRAISGLVVLGLIVVPTATLATQLSEEGVPAEAADRSISESADQPAVDPRADRVLRAMGDYLKNARAFSFRVDEVFDEILEGDTKVQFGVRNEIAVRRPNGIRANSEGDLGRERFWYDGKQIVLMDYDAMRFRRAAAPDTIDAALDYAAENLDLNAPLSDLVYSDPYQILIENVETGSYLGIHHVRGRSAHHLLFTQAGIDWQVWIADDWVPVPLKVVITYKNVQHSPQFIAWLSHWEFAPYLPDSLFTFDAPEGAVEETFDDSAGSKGVDEGNPE